MTFIQPNKNRSLVTIILVVFCVAVFAAGFWMVALYNNVVNLNHNIAAAKAKLDTIGADNTRLNNEVLATIGGGNIQSLAAQNNLVEDQKPQYFETAKQWAIASHY